MEALACGVPIVTWGLGETARIVERDQAGLTCRPGDADDLARKIRTAMADPQLMSRLGRNGRKTYEQYYTRAAAYDRPIEIYKTAASRGA